MAAETALSTAAPPDTAAHRLGAASRSAIFACAATFMASWTGEPGFGSPLGQLELPLVGDVRPAELPARRLPRRPSAERRLRRATFTSSRELLHAVPRVRIGHPMMPSTSPDKPAPRALPQSRTPSQQPSPSAGQVVLAVPPPSQRFERARLAGRALNEPVVRVDRDPELMS
jgi:hypothetical protein